MSGYGLRSRWKTDEKTKGVNDIGVDDKAFNGELFLEFGVLRLETIATGAILH